MIDLENNIVPIGTILDFKGKWYILCGYNFTFCLYSMKDGNAKCVPWEFQGPSDGVVIPAETWRIGGPPVVVKLPELYTDNRLIERIVNDIPDDNNDSNRETTRKCIKSLMRQA